LAQVGDQVRDQVLDQVGDQVRDQVRDQVLDQVGEQVRAQVGEQVRAQVWAQVRAQVWDQVREQVRAQVYKACYGTHDANWLAFYNYFEEVTGLSLSAVNGLQQAARYCGWFWAFKDACIITSKPKVIRMIEGRLHADGEPSIQYEGFSVYSYEGIRMPEKYGSVHSSKWDPKWIDEESNADIRSKLLKGVGFERWMGVSDGKTIHEQELFGLPYKLIVKQDRDIGTMKFLHMKNPSVPGVYHLEPIAPHDWIQTCEDALNWRLGAESPKEKYNVIFKA
jgi:hypothetical protein